MDPIDREPEEYGQDGDGAMPRPRPPREPLTTDFASPSPAPARTTRLIAGEHLLTVNPVDGSEIAACPPGERPARPVKRTAADRAEADRAARPPVPPGPAAPTPSLLERQDDRERLVRLLARGRSVRLTGPAGSGRTSLLDLVAEDCADLAPDGVVRLDGSHRTADDLLHDLLHAVHDAPLHRPDHGELLTLVREIGAVVVVDDIEFGGAALDTLLDATPECAFLLGATPDVPAPSADSGVEEVLLGGLDRAGGVAILERAVGRTLTEEEANWAGDLWFESEGLPLRFVQAGALLDQRDRQRAEAGAVDLYGVFADQPPAADAADLDPDDAAAIPLPSLGEAAAPAPLLASRLSGPARDTLRFAVALAGEVPHQAHLPALIGDTHADAALGELAACGLVSPVGPRYRLAAGVLTQLEAAGYGESADGAEPRALTAAQHYAWWAGHPSVAPERVCAEADAVLAALAALVPDTVPAAEDEERPVAVRLARAAAPAFAAGLHWSAWERALRAGAEAARLAGEVAEQAYFHHELGVLALCEGQLDRARAELEVSVGLRGALADQRGTVAGRRALALVADRSGTAPGVVAALAPAASDEARDTRAGESAGPGTALMPAVPFGDGAPTVVTHRAPVAGKPAARGRAAGLKALARRNLVAAGAGALLVAVLGTVVTLGATSNNDADTPSDRVGVNPTAGVDLDDGSVGADAPTAGDSHTTDTGTATGRATDPGPDGTLGTSDDPTPSGSGRPSADPTGSRGPSGSAGQGQSSRPPSSRPSSGSPTTSRPSDPPSGGSGSPSDSPTPSDGETPDPTGSATGEPSTTDSASGPGTPSTPVQSSDGTASASASPSASVDVI
ncbi:ATP-binding protein [Streptomyces sp. NPDC101249]|uniref:ATP-binding protein n=1 Tax=Streptomyces sp. NPDC101249 TaxID=3366140 RepID=UPI0038267741